MRHLITTFIIVVLGLVWHAAAQVIPAWSSGVAVPGEQILLYLIDTEVGEDLFSVKDLPNVRYAGVQVLQSKAGANPLDPNRAMVQILPILVRPDKAGVLEIGDITVEYCSGRKQNVSIPPLPVCSTAEIKWYHSPEPYGALWYTYPKDAYVHQPVRAALKLFIPRDCFVSNLPQLHSVGVKIDPLQQSVQGVLAIVQGQLMENPTAFAHGQNWRTADFSGELTPFREGNSDITGKILLARQRGIFTVSQEEIPLPTLTLPALPLPPGAPSDFADTVGNYSVSARCEASSLAMNESVEVQITVRGSGNLQQLECPLPDDSSNWKLVPATRKPIVSASGETVGMVFSQLMRPVAEVSGIPSFSLSYFDPKAMSYKRAASPPIPLPWRESDATGNALVQAVAAPPPAGSVPVAELTDIYDFISPEHTGRRVFVLPRALWYLLYLPALAVFGYLTWGAITRRLVGKSAERHRERELQSIAHEQDALSFLKSVGAFIEANVPPEIREEENLLRILKRRDDEAFRPEAAPRISSEERSEMLRAVRKALAKTVGILMLLALALGSLGFSNDTSPEDLYRGRQYSKALEQLERMQKENGTSAADADILSYDIGVCQYRLGRPGPAALSFARALTLNPSFPEARANLDFIQRKEGALLPVHSDVDQLFTLLSFGQLRLTTVICTAALALCIAGLLLRRRLPWLRAVTAFFSLLSLLCLVNWLYYATRDSADFNTLPSSDLAFVLSSSPLRTAATPDASALMQLSPSTPLHLLARRGSFSYVETATGLRGWIASDAVESLAPSSPPRSSIFIRFR